MHVINHLYFVSILSLSLAAAPPSYGRHGSLQARGCVPGKNCFSSKTLPPLERPSLVNPPPVVEKIRCSGTEQHHCETYCYCNPLGKVVCDKKNHYSDLFTLKFCAHKCSCVLNGVRIPGVWDGDHQEALEREIYNSRAGARAHEAKMKIAQEAYLREAGATGQPGAGPSKAGGPGAGPSGGLGASTNKPPSFASQPFAPNVDKGLDGSNKNPPTIVSHPSAVNVDAGLVSSSGGGPGAGSSNAESPTERQRSGSRKFGEAGAGPLNAVDSGAGPSHSRPSPA